MVDNQNGFRKNRSCLDHIFVLNTILKNKLNGSPVGVMCTFVDFRKAFDVTDRQLLFLRLSSYGITGTTLELIKQLYSHTTNVIRLNGVLTGEFISEQGVRQGDNLSPTCFSTYLNGLLCELKNSKIGVKLGNETVNVLAYADDLVLLAETATDMQKLLDITNNWCNNWKLTVNANKTKIVHFRRKNFKNCQAILKMGETVLNQADNYRYLGVMLNYNTDVTQIIDQLYNAGSRALSQIISKTKANMDLNFKTYSKLFESGGGPYPRLRQWCLVYK